MNCPEELSLDYIGRQQHRRVLAVHRPLSLTGKILDGITLGEAAEDVSCCLMWRAGPAVQLDAVVRAAAHSSPMSHACSRSFFE